MGAIIFNIVVIFGLLELGKQELGKWLSWWLSYNYKGLNSDLQHQSKMLDAPAIPALGKQRWKAPSRLAGQPIQQNRWVPASETEPACIRQQDTRKTPTVSWPLHTYILSLSLPLSPRDKWKSGAYSLGNSVFLQPLHFHYQWSEAKTRSFCVRNNVTLER